MKIPWILIWCENLGHYNFLEEGSGSIEKIQTIFDSLASFCYFFLDLGQKNKIVNKEKREISCPNTLLGEKKPKISISTSPWIDFLNLFEKIQLMISFIAGLRDQTEAPLSHHKKMRPYYLL